MQKTMATQTRHNKVAGGQNKSKRNITKQVTFEVELLLTVLEKH